LSNLELLDSPVWTSLKDRHGKLGRVSGKAAVYDWEVSILGGLQEPNADALADLANLVEPGNAVALMGPLTDLPLDPCWEHVTRVEIHQMICDDPRGFNEQGVFERFFGTTGSPLNNGLSSIVLLSYFLIYWVMTWNIKTTSQE